MPETKKGIKQPGFFSRLKSLAQGLFFRAGESKQALPEGEILLEGVYEFEERKINVYYRAAPRILGNEREWQRRVERISRRDEATLSILDILKSTLLAPQTYITEYGNKATAEETQWRDDLAASNELLNYAATESIYRIAVLTRLTSGLQMIEFLKGRMKEQDRDFFMTRALTLMNYLQGRAPVESFARDYRQMEPHQKQTMTVIAYYLAERALVSLGALSEKELRDTVKFPVRKSQLGGANFQE